MQVRELSLFITDLLLSGVCIQFSHIFTQTFVHKHIICEALLKEIETCKHYIHKSFVWLRCGRRPSVVIYYHECEGYKNFLCKML